MPCRAHLAHIGESANYFDGRHLCHLGHHVHPRFSSYTLHCHWYARRLGVVRSSSSSAQCESYTKAALFTGAAPD